uniref:Uncharacterized protein LOC111138409 isoform X1 n=1 Tax=Crassostrea virginica TaxID=6565 RepID=A0A8B8F1L1_CRAVI|nr:uncharacterized protein LOC111138409 isoform X1 [Crassostrea virginica]
MLEPPILVFLIYLSILTECVKAEDCLESPNTLKIVRRCPANGTEWEREAKIKNCSKIHGINGCQKVEYHCLVNAYRNETIEICSTPRIIQAFCPIYHENIPNQDYNRPCQNFSSPFNCSGPYNSTESYKWQICYEYVYNQSTDASQEKGHTGTLDKSPKISNGWFALLALIPIGLVLMYGVCVLYHYKCKQEPMHKAFCFFKSTISSSDIEETGMLGGSSANANGTPVTVTPDGDQVELPGIEDDNAREETRLLEASSANTTAITATLTPDTEKIGIPDIEETGMLGGSSANANGTPVTVTPDGDQAELPGNENDNASEETRLKEASSANATATTATLPPDAEKMGIPATIDQNQDAVPYHLPTSGNLPPTDTPINERVKDIEEDFNILKKRLDFINADHVKDLEFEMTSIAKKIEIYFKKPYQSGVGLVSQNENLRGKVRDIEEKLQKFHQILDDFGLDQKYLQRKGNEQRGINVSSTVETKDTVRQYFNKHTDGEKKGINKSSTSKIKVEKNPRKLQEEEETADSSITKRVEERDDEDVSDEDNSWEEGHGPQWKSPLQGSSTQLTMKNKTQKKSTFEETDGACSTTLPKAYHDKKDEDQPNLKTTLKDQVKDLAMEYEEYKGKYGNARGELPKLQLKVWEIESDLTILARIHRLEETQNTTDFDLSEIKKKLSKTKNFFNDMKSEFELEQG